MIPIIADDGYYDSLWDWDWYDYDEGCNFDCVICYPWI